MIEYLQEAILIALAGVIYLIINKNRKSKSISQPEILELRKELRTANDEVVVKANQTYRIIDKFLEKLQNGTG